MKLVKLALSFILILSVVSCASVAGDNNRAIHVSSYPEGASIYVDNQRYGATPATINLPTYIYGGKTVTLKKRGFKEQSIAVNTRFQPIALLDVLFWPGFLIDAATGSLVKVDPSSLSMQSKLQVA